MSSSDTKSPRPRPRPARRWDSSGKAVTSPRQRSSVPQAGIPGRAGAGLRAVAFPPPRLAFPGGVLSSWVGPHRKAERENDVFTQTNFFLYFSQTSPESPLIPTRPRLGQREGSQSLPGAGLGCPRYLVPPGSQGNLVSGWGGREGPRGGSGPARAGLHRPLLGK